MFNKNTAISAGLVVALSFQACMPTLALAEPTAQEQALNKLESLGSELDAIQGELDSKTAQMEETQVEIDKTQAQIIQTSQKLDEAKQTLSKLTRSNYKTGNGSVLDVIFESSSFEDLANRLYYMNKTSKENVEAISAVQKLSSELAAQNQVLEDRKQSLEASISATQSKLAAYQQKVDEAQAYFNSLDEETQQRVESEAQASEEALVSNSNATSSNTSNSHQGSSSTKNSSVSTAVQAIRSNNSSPASTSTNTSQNSQSSSTSNNSSTSQNNISQTTTQSKPKETYNSFSGAGIESARSLIGVMYKWGGSNPNRDGGVDCSGLVIYSYGTRRGRSTYEMINSLKASGDWKTSISELNPGDLIFTSSGHVGVYLGNNRMIHAPAEGRRVCETRVWAFYGGGSY
ncbi:C40 family peptidase [Atopobium fossor]|uniref:C40 family peptidase n=1 Tax=Atopobium fossor TaxID=39487 RepID=UPI00041FA0B2|nr:C40 family peptidase [Atopobium fossor]